MIAESIQKFSKNCNFTTKYGIMGYSRKKQTGGWVHAFFKTPLEFLGFLIYPWKFLAKLHP